MENKVTMPNTRTLSDVLITNWAVYTCTRFKIRNSALITGANESGKSTIIDALTYAMFGITDFNIQAGAGEDERSVFAYVKGDTKDNEDRFLRDNQDVTSYIAVDIFNPKDGTYLTEGVCIELYKGDTKTRSQWFVVNGAKIDDFNFYTKNENKIVFTARQDLRCRGQKIKFMRKEEGISTFLRQAGLRLAQNGTRELKRKIRQLLACGKKKMQIDAFVRSSIFEEDDSAGASLDNILKHKSEYEQLAADLKRLTAEKELLETVEKGYLDYMELSAEAVRREIARKKYFYMRKKGEDETLAREIKDMEARNRMLQGREIRAAVAAREAQTEYDKAAAAVRDGQRPIEELREHLAGLKMSLAAAEDQIASLKGLAKSAKDIFGGQDYVAVPDAALSAAADAGSPEADEEKVLSALEALEHARTALCSALLNAREELGYRRRDMNRELDALNSEIHTLRQNRKVLPEGMEEELAVLRREGTKAGAKGEIRLVCDLVNEVDPKWQTAAETFLGGRRFNVIVPPEDVPAMLRIIDEKNLHHIFLVLTNKMDDIGATAPQGSLAAKMQIANIYARKYINSVCGNIKCVETRRELNDNPKGAIMPNGLMARGIVAHKMKAEKDLVFGRDAIERQLKKRTKERDALQNALGTLEAERRKTSLAYERAGSVSFSPADYDAAAPKTAIKLRDEIAGTKKNIKALENNPSARRLMEMLTNAETRRNAANDELVDIRSRMRADASRLTEKKTALDRGRTEEKTLSDEYETACTLHPEEKKAADALYEKQKNNAEASLVRAAQDVEKRKNEASERMVQAMLRYNVNHAGYTPDAKGAPQYIERLNELRTKDIDATRNKVEAKEQAISDSFMKDFVEVLYDRIRGMRDQKDAINEMLKNHKFGDKSYSLTMKQRTSADMKAFFTIATRMDAIGGAETLDFYLASNNSFMNEPAFRDAFDAFRDTVLGAEDVTEYTDYRNYYTYDFLISDGEHTAYLSKSQGIYSGGGRQTPYFILLTAALMTSYRGNGTCMRIAFIDEAFASMDEDRIRSMIDYFNDNGLQVIYAAPDKTMHNIAPYVDTTVAVVKKNRQAAVIDAQMEF